MVEVITHVAAGILINEVTQQFMLASRPEGKVYAGYWEFPGGKLEAGETAYQALVRELDEELGIQVIQATPWLVQTFSYPHATVRLQFFKVTAWRGQPQPKEGQQFAWFKQGTQAIDAILPANAPILAALALPPVISISHAELIGVDAYLGQLEQQLQQSPRRMVLVRDKSLPPKERHRLSVRAHTLTQAYGVPLILHADAPLLDLPFSPDGWHMSTAQCQQADLPAYLATLPVAGKGIYGASCHSAQALQQAAEHQLNYAFLSPILPTATHPQAPALGWAKAEAIIATGYALPIYGLGGLSLDAMQQAQAIGLHGVAGMRSV